MNYLKLLVKTLYSTDAVFQLKNTKLYLSLIVLVFYTTFLNFGLVTSFIKMNTIDPTLLSKNIYQDLTIDKISKIPDCKISNDLQLICDSKEVFIQEFENFNLIINPDKLVDINNNRTNIIFMQNEIKITNKDELAYNLDYKHFQGVDFQTYHLLDSKSIVDDISNRLFLSLKPYVIMPILSIIYLIVIFYNFIFIFGLASVGMLFNFGSPNRLKFKEILNMVIYTSIIPSLLAFFVSIGISPIFGVVVYNFSLSLLFLYVYKNEIKGNLS